MSRIIQHYTKDYKISIEESQKRIEDLTTYLKGNEFYYRRHHPSSSLTLLTESKNNSIEWEIEYYKSAIITAKQEEEEEEMPLSETDLRIDDLENQLGAVQDSVYQIIGGIFNKHTQKETLNDHINQLYQMPSNETTTSISEQESKYPTTRQGDENERQIEILKKQVAKLEYVISIMSQTINGLLV